MTRRTWRLMRSLSLIHIYIQKNYHLPYPRTMGERIALARQQSGAEKLKGHDIMALERFDPEVRHMVVFDVLSFESPVGDKGDKMRLFLTDEGYRKAMELSLIHISYDSNVIHYRRVEIIGTFGAEASDYNEAAKLLNTRAIDVSKIVEPKRFKLDDCQAAFEAASTPGMYRVCIELN